VAVLSRARGCTQETVLAGSAGAGEVLEDPRHHDRLVGPAGGEDAGSRGATASTEDKRDAARAAGADHMVDYRTAGAAAEILEFTGSRGIDRVIDVNFAANLPLVSAVLGTNGIIAAYGSDLGLTPHPGVTTAPVHRPVCILG
jgi:hypothetical protein